MDDMSLYEATQSVLDDHYKVEPASKWLRLVNLLIDYVAFWVLGVVVGFVIIYLFGNESAGWFEGVPGFLIGISISLGYYIILEGATGRTLGKLVTGTKVVNEVGGAPSFTQILGRCLSRFIPFEAFSFLGDDGRGWHDSIPNTYVIKCR
ncbi:MAG: RDD family protein [Alcanivorax sp.]|nr:RDD family protein [Alcanivorax sp.]